MAVHHAGRAADVDRGNNEFTERHVYEPHRAGLPKLGVYVRELLRRRQFLWEMARANMRTQNLDTAFGQIWLVLNPLLLGCVYFLLVDLLGKGQPAEFFAHLLAGLFAYYLITGCMTAGAKSVTSGGKLVLNTAFPRLLLPLASSLTAFMRFLPTLVVFEVVALIAHVYPTWLYLWAPLLIAEFLVFGAGLAFIVATAQVYIRDTSSFLPYFVRIWLYVSPVLLTVENLHNRTAAHGILWMEWLNPLYWLLGAWSKVLVYGQFPGWHFLVVGFVISVVTFVAGALLFISREREFAVRL